MVRSYLAHDEVSSKNPSGQHFEAALRIFVSRRPADRPPADCPPAALLQEATQEPSSVEDVLMRLRTLREQLDEYKSARYGAQVIFTTQIYQFSWTSKLT